MTAKAPVQAAVTILVLCMGIGYEIWGMKREIKGILKTGER